AGGLARPPRPGAAAAGPVRGAPRGHPGDDPDAAAAARGAHGRGAGGARLHGRGAGRAARGRRGVSLLLVCRWRCGPGPAGGRRYRGPEEGLLLAAAAEEAAAPAGAEQASLYRPWQGLPGPGAGFLDGAAPVVLFAVDVAAEAAAAWDQY